jgi:outer membrane autotransporter protein
LIQEFENKKKMKSLPRVSVVCALTSIAALPVSPTQAAVVCTTSGNDVTCTQADTVGNGVPMVATANNGGNASATNTGTFGSAAFIESTANGAGTGNATAINAGTTGDAMNLLASTNGGGNATVSNTGTSGKNDTLQAFAFGTGNATATNAGTTGDNLTIQTQAGTGSATTSNTGTTGNNATVQATTGTGTATATNTGTVGNHSFLNSFSGSTGNVIVTNSGTFGTNANIQAITVNGTATATNSGTIGAGSTVGASTNSGNATVTNSGTIGPNGTVTAATGNGNATVVNSGTILSQVAVSSLSGTATLTNTAGSLIVGTIGLSGTTKILNFVGGGNYVYTLQSMAGVQVNANGAPFAVSGNTVAVLDPTGFALADRSVTNFAGFVSSVLQDRFSGMGVAGGARSSAPLGFAAEPAGFDRISAAHDAFSGMPTVSMSYASDDSKARHALAMSTKAPVAPAVPLNDITVWTSGFGGERHQSAYDNIQRARDDAYGAAIGVDRLFTPDLRLGVFAGGGASQLRTDFNVQNVDSNYGFGGVYGRYDRHDWYVDLALFGGGISSKSTRQVANNLAGFETATANYNGWFFSPDVTAGYRMFTNWGIVTPKARVRYVGGTLDGYTETGSAQGLTVGSRDLSDIEERLGVEVSSTRPVGYAPGWIKLTAELDAVGLQRLGDNTINAVLLAQNIAFTTPGKSQAFGGAASAIVEWKPVHNVSLYLSAEGMVMDDHSYSVVGKGGVRVGL